MRGRRGLVGGGACLGARADDDVVREGGMAFPGLLASTSKSHALQQSIIFPWAAAVPVPTART